MKEEFNLEDWKIITEEDELAYESGSNLTASEHTMYNFDLDGDLVQDSNWDVAIDLEATAEATIYDDGIIAFAKAGDAANSWADYLVEGAVVNVGEDISSQLISYMEESADELEREGEVLRVNTPPRLNAFRDNYKTSVPVEETNAVGVQTENVEIGERYHNSLPTPAAEVIGFAQEVTKRTLTRASIEGYDEEDGKIQGNYNVEVP